MDGEKFPLAIFYASAIFSLFGGLLAGIIVSALNNLRYTQTNTDWAILFIALSFLGYFGFICLKRLKENLPPSL